MAEDLRKPEPKAAAEKPEMESPQEPKPEINPETVKQDILEEDRFQSTDN